ncbi:hypothetical protein BQ8794_230097 [Mesorhizobium prunaredense]|uniref:Uncharacterized protein n=1 Tax=Mesorhizobium prunaredense TaxID=1631249 RepID=A0A1R3VBP4_9HYPH|nr:hypothetical protein BQ8794_230097 [Mesorhizobium prunaredense]
MHASAAQLPARIQRTDLFNIRDHPAMLEHDIDADLSHNAIPLRRIYALNNGNKADDIPRSRHSDRHPAGRIQLSGGHRDRGDHGFAIVRHAPGRQSGAVAEPQTLWLTSPSYRRSEATPPASGRPVARYLLMAVAFVFLVA